jgi:hypothetical protein
VSYLADVIASASVAAQGSGEDGIHVEVRQGVAATLGKAFALGENELDVSAHAVHSWESDYISWIYGARAAYSFNQKNTGLSLGVSGVNDTIYKNQPARTYYGDLDGVTVNLGFSQILSPTLTFGAGYQVVYLTGFLGNPYRRVKIGPLPYDEKPPETRLRHNWEATAAWFVPSTGTTIQGFARFYTDSWSLQAITPELRVYQALGRDFNLRLRGRFYAQNGASFASTGPKIDEYVRGYTGPYTSDPKLSAFHSTQLGARLSYALTVLEGTVLDFVSRGVLDVSFDYQWTTIPSASFGRTNMFGIIGGRLPF